VGPDDPRALKLLAGDNEISRLAEIDDRALTDMLKEIKLADPDGLLGTGFDDAMLANLLFVTRPASEIADMDVAGQWVGMPEYEEGRDLPRLIITFAKPEDRERYVNEGKLKIDKRVGYVWCTRWPWTERHDNRGFRFEPSKAGN
jgi:hypothetical protein